MKKNILIFGAVLISFSLAALGYENWNKTTVKEEMGTQRKVAVFHNDLVNGLEKGGLDLFYNVDSRFIHTITKEDLHQARSVADLFPEKATKSVVSYQNTRIYVLHDEHETTEVGESELLNSAQLELLKSLDYSTNLRVTSICKRGNTISDKLRSDSIVYYMTIIPEKEAEFANGHEALIQYLKANSEEKTAIIEDDKVRPAKVKFTITKEGTINNVKLSSTSGYLSVDEALVELISNMPEKWNPATNAKGDKVDQELIFFFGSAGC